MFSAIAGYIRAIGLFLIFITFVTALMPKSRYKDFIGVVLGIMLVFVVIGPARALLDGNYSSLEEAGLDFSKTMLTQSGQNMDEEQRAAILSSYKMELEKQITAVAESYTDLEIRNVNAIIDDGDNIGELKAIYILLGGKKEDKESGFGIIRIEQIKTNIWNNSEESEDEGTARLKNSLSDFYNVHPDNIYITAQKSGGTD